MTTRYDYPFGTFTLFLLILLGGLATAVEGCFGCGGF